MSRSAYSSARQCKAVTDSNVREPSTLRKGVAALQFTEPLTITRRLSKSGGSLGLLIPKEIVETLQLDSSSLVEIKLRKVVSVPIQPSKLVGA